MVHIFMKTWPADDPVCWISMFSCSIHSGLHLGVSRHLILRESQDRFICTSLQMIVRVGVLTVQILCRGK